MKKKILFYTSGVGLGGVERVIIEILKFIDKNKFDIKLGLQYENENLFANEIPKKVEFKYMLPISVINRSLYFKKKKKNIFYRILYSLHLNYEKYLIKKNYKEFSKDRDIVIDFKSGDFYKLLKYNKNKNKIIWLHGEVTKLNKYSKRKNTLLKEWKKYDKIICICNRMKNNLIKEMPELEEKIDVLYNPFDVEYIRKKAEDLTELTIEEKKLINDEYFIMVSRLELKMKDFQTLIKGYELAIKNGATGKLYILGDGNDREKIETLINESEQKNNIILLGQKKNPYPLIANAKALIHSSKYEGFGMVLVEALILRTNVISSDCLVGPREILENGNYGYLFEVGNSTELCKKILELDLKKSINFDTAIEKFKQENIISEIEDILLRL